MPDQRLSLNNLTKPLWEVAVKEIWDAIMKQLPPDIIPVVLLLAASFFGIYFYKGLRNYTDALNDRWFLSSGVIIISLFALYWIQKPRSTQVEAGTTVALLVPRFEDDEGRQIENLFAQQVEAAAHALNPKAAVVQTDSFVRDREAAVLTLRSRDALAIVFHPKVVRVKEKILICFSMLLRDLETTKPFPPVAAELEKATLSELASTIMTNATMAEGQPQPDLLQARLTAIEQRLESMNSVLLRIAAMNRVGETTMYQKKRAIVIGINDYQAQQLPRLAGAVKDANNLASYLRSAEFEVSLLRDHEATASAVRDALGRAAGAAEDGDMLLIFYSGMSFRATDATNLASVNGLVLPPYDFSFEAGQNVITLSDLVVQARQTRGDTLIVLDGCHGTFGVHAAPSGPATRSGNLQVLASTQDNEFAADTPSGGLFTQALVKYLAGEGSGKPISTSEILAGVAPEVVRMSDRKQHPKLLTLAGARDVTIVGPELHGREEKAGNQTAK